MLISVGFNAFVCRGEANSVIVDFVEQIKTDNPTAIALVCSSDSAIAIATMKMVVMETIATMATRLCKHTHSLLIKRMLGKTSNDKAPHLQRLPAVNDSQRAPLNLRHQRDPLSRIEHIVLDRQRKSASFPGWRGHSGVLV
jgi:hypothetical protein